MYFKSCFETVSLIWYRKWIRKEHKQNGVDQMTFVAVVQVKDDGRMMVTQSKMLTMEMEKCGYMKCISMTCYMHWIQEVREKKESRITVSEYIQVKSDTTDWDGGDCEKGYILDEKLIVLF